jgi:hypothetical protein
VDRQLDNGWTTKQICGAPICSDVARREEENAQGSHDQQPMDTRYHWCSYCLGCAWLPKGMGTPALSRAPDSSIGSLHLNVVRGRYILSIFDISCLLRRIHQTARCQGTMADQGAVEDQNVLLVGPPSEALDRWASQTHGLQINDVYALCDQHVETASHLFLACVFARQVWLDVLARLQMVDLISSGDHDLGIWWIDQRKRIDEASQPLCLTACYY